MLGKITLAAALLAFGAGITPASAAPALPQSRPTAGIDSLVQQTKIYHHHHHHHGRFGRFGRGVFIGLGAGYGYGYGYCGTWRDECAARWGWRTRGYYRCVWRHGC